MKPTRMEPRQYEVPGDDWNRLVTQCGGSSKYFMHADEEVRFMADPTQSSDLVGAEGRTTSSEAENPNGHFNGHPQHSRMNSKIRYLAHIIGGAVRSVRTTEEGMPAGILNAGLRAPAFRAL